jgi:hypothetical protein
VKLDQSNGLNKVGAPTSQIIMETDQVSEMFCSLENWMIDKYKNPVTLTYALLCLCKYKAYLKYTYTEYSKGSDSEYLAE